jgi:hypothetical protein
MLDGYLEIYNTENTFSSIPYWVGLFLCCCDNVNPMAGGQGFEPQ